jgi:8-oxo-dGTP pyrophosphatase MutT (NUDIX family)
VSLSPDSYVGWLRGFVGTSTIMIPGTRVFVEDEAGRLLMQLRSDFRLWGFLGGHAEVGEPFEDCVIREVREEVGLEVGDLVPVALSCDPRHETLVYPNGDCGQFIVVMYWTRAFSGELSIRDSESLELGWFAPDAMPPMLPTMQRGFEAFLEYRRTGRFQVI